MVDTIKSELARMLLETIESFDQGQLSTGELFRMEEDKSRNLTRTFKVYTPNKPRYFIISIKEKIK